MGNQSSKGNEGNQSQTNQSQTNQGPSSGNPLLDRPLNPKLQMTVQKGQEKPTLERVQKPSNIREQKRQR